MSRGRCACHVTQRAAHQGHRGTRIPLPSEHILCQRHRSPAIMTEEAAQWASPRRCRIWRKEASRSVEKSFQTASMQILQCIPLMTAICLVQAVARTNRPRRNERSVRRAVFGGRRRSAVYAGRPHLLTGRTGVPWLVASARSHRYEPARACQPLGPSTACTG
jgi:hypothetical protein